MIHTVDQNSEAWFDLRRGKLTASEVGEWLIADPKLTLTGPDIKRELEELKIEYKKTSKVGELAELLPTDVVNANQGYLKKDTEARRNAMCKMLGKELSPITEEWTGNRFTDFGNAFEEEACAEFELRTGYHLEPGHFVTLEGFDYFGASPDKRVFSADKSMFLGPLEVKCKPEEHAAMVIDGVLPPENRLQVHFQMVMTGAEQAFFFGYSPDMNPLFLKVEADGLTRKMERALAKFDADYKEFRAENLPKLQIK